jgi:hypothetical protein
MMKFAFKIFWTKNGRLELLLEPSPLDLRSIDTAHRLAKNFAAYAPVSLITIEAEDGSISELWFRDGRCEIIALDYRPTAIAAD